MTPASPRSPPSVRSDARPSRGRDGVVVACGGLKGGRADWLVEKCAELGAASLVPLLTERSPTVGGAERDKSNKEKHGRGKGKGTSARRGNKQAAAGGDDAPSKTDGRAVGARRGGGE